MLTLSAQAYDEENVTYHVKSFTQSGQFFPQSYLADYPNRDTLIPQPTAALSALPVYQNGNDPAKLTLLARVCRPDNAVGKLPTVIVVHGSGGLWPENGPIGQNMENQFEDWAQELTDRGYMAVFPDSYNPRGIPEGFSNRRPHDNPAIDSDRCAPQFDRPRDIEATLDYLTTRNDVACNKVSVVSFSQGAEAVYNAFNDDSINRANNAYFVSRIDAQNNEDHSYDVPSPVRISKNHVAYPRFIALYYPGCHSRGYNGRISAKAPHQYYPTTDARVAMFHGSADALYNSSGYDAFHDRIALHGIDQNLPQAPFAFKEVYQDADHSFDNLALSNNNQNNANNTAHADARAIVYAELDWIDNLPTFCPGIVYVHGKDILAPGIVFTAKAHLVYDVFRKGPRGRLVPIMTDFGGYDGEVAIPLRNKRDRIDNYIIEYGREEPDRR